MKQGRASWGDSQLDDLWRQMYEIEKGMDDVDLVSPDSPKLKKWEAANAAFRKRMFALDAAKQEVGE